MGNRPCETDCAVFGMLAQARWQMPGTPHERMVNGKLICILIHVYGPDGITCTLSFLIQLLFGKWVSKIKLCLVFYIF